MSKHELSVVLCIEVVVTASDENDFDRLRDLASDYMTNELTGTDFEDDETGGSVEFCDIWPEPDTANRLRAALRGLIATVRALRDQGFINGPWMMRRDLERDLNQIEEVVNDA